MDRYAPIDIEDKIRRGAWRVTISGVIGILANIVFLAFIFRIRGSYQRIYEYIEIEVPYFTKLLLNPWVTVGVGIICFGYFLVSFRQKRVAGEIMGVIGIIGIGVMVNVYSYAYLAPLAEVSARISQGQ